MDTPDLEADHVVAGADAASMAFADELLYSSNSAMVFIDRRHAADAYVGHTL